jgi:hypothetical protein
VPARIRALPRALVTGAAVLVLTVLAVGVVRQMGEQDEPVRLSREDGTTTTTGSTTTTQATTTTIEATTTTAPPATEPPASQPPSTAADPPAPPEGPPYQSSIEPVTADHLGSSWKAGMGCPDPSTLRAVNVSHWGYDGAVHPGRIIVAASQAENTAGIFRDLYDARFPIQRIVPIDAYAADDQASMRANNTSGFNCRYVAGTTRLSQHGLGLAIDVNPLHNPYVRNGTVDPPEGATWADRSRNDPGMIKADDAAVRAFARHGWSWGGYWSSGKDYQHFSTSGT